MAKYRVGISWGELTDRIARGEMQAHRFPHGYVVTEIKDFHEERVLMVQLLRGERFEEWMRAAHKHLREFAKERGCVAIEAICRPGLEPLLKQLGWKRTRVLLRDQIT